MTPDARSTPSTSSADLLVDISTLRQAIEHNVRRTDPNIDAANWPTTMTHDHELRFDWPTLNPDRPVRVRTTDRDIGRVEPRVFVRSTQGVPTLRTAVRGVCETDDVWGDQHISADTLAARIFDIYRGSWDTFWATTGFTRSVDDPDLDRPLQVKYVDDCPNSGPRSSRDHVIRDRLARAGLLQRNSR